MNTPQPQSVGKTVLRQETKEFIPFDELSQKTDKKSVDLQSQLQTARLTDIRFKIGIRILFTVFFMTLLSFQNWAVFSIIQKSLAPNILKDLQLIFTALVGATLTETYFMTQTIFEWMFRDIDYTGQQQVLPKPSSV